MLGVQKVLHKWLCLTFSLVFLSIMIFPRVEILAFFQSFVEMKKTMESNKCIMKINFI